MCVSYRFGSEVEVRKSIQLDKQLVHQLSNFFMSRVLLISTALFLLHNTKHTASNTHTHTYHHLLCVFLLVDLSQAELALFLVQRL